MIIQDIVWADIVSWLHHHGIRIERYGARYSVFFPEENLAVIVGSRDHCVSDDRGTSVTVESLSEALRMACKIADAYTVGKK